MKTNEIANQKIEKILKNEVTDRHTYFQLKNFLIGKEPTIQSKLWRCIREIKIRKDSIDSINLEIEDLQDEIQLINIKKENIEKQENIEKHELTAIKEIKIRKLLRKKISLNKRLFDLNQKLKNLTEECDFLANCFFELEKIEKLKNYDDPQEQEKYWNAKLTEELNTKLIFGLPPDPELIKTIYALDSDSAVKINLISLINNINEKHRSKIGNKNDI